MNTPVCIILTSVFIAVILGCIIYFKKDKKGENNNNCLQYEEQINGKCQCIKDYVKNSENKCVQSPPTCADPNEEQINGKCQCIKGYLKNNENKCVQSRPSRPSRPICTDPNEEQVDGGCECKLGYEYASDKKCRPLSLTKYGHYNNPILGGSMVGKMTDGSYGFYILMFDNSGVFRGTTNIKQIDIFDGYVNDSLICCDKDGIVYYLDNDSDNWKTFNAGEKAYCRVSYGGKIRMAVTLSGKIFKNENKVSSLPLSKGETVVAFSILPFGDPIQQIIFTSKGNVYFSLNSGDTWTRDKREFILKNHQLKISLNYNVKHFYLLSDMKLYKVVIDSDTAVTYTPILTDFEISCFDIYGQEIVHFYGSNKDNNTNKFMCLYNWVNNTSVQNIVLTNVPYTIVDIKQLPLGLYVSTTTGDVYMYNFTQN